MIGRWRKRERGQKCVKSEWLMFEIWWVHVTYRTVLFEILIARDID